MRCVIFLPYCLSWLHPVLRQPGSFIFGVQISWIAACELLVRERQRQQNQNQPPKASRGTRTPFKYDQHIDWLLAGMELVPGAMEVYGVSFTLLLGYSQDQY